MRRFVRLHVKILTRFLERSGFKRVNLKIVLIGGKGKSRFDNDVIIDYSCSHNEFTRDAPL